MLGKKFHVVLISISHLTAQVSWDSSFVLINPSANIKVSPEAVILKITVPRVNRFQARLASKSYAFRHLPWNGVGDNQSNEGCNHKFQARKSRVWPSFDLFAPAPSRGKRCMSVCIYRAISR